MAKEWRLPSPRLPVGTTEEAIPQSLTLKNSSILDEGTYEAILTIGWLTHFNSHLMPQ